MRTLGKILEALGRGMVATPSLYWTVPMLPPPWELQRRCARLHDGHSSAGRTS